MKQTRAARRFGNILWRRRIAAGMTLRAFCARGGLDPTYVGRIEAGLLSSPGDAMLLGRLLRTLGPRAGARRWRKIFKLARMGAHLLPRHMSQETMAALFPALHRITRGRKTTRKDARRFLRQIVSK